MPCHNTISVAGENISRISKSRCRDNKTAWNNLTFLDSFYHGLFHYSPLQKLRYGRSCLNPYDLRRTRRGHYRCPKLQFTVISSLSRGRWRLPRIRLTQEGVCHGVNQGGRSASRVSTSRMSWASFHLTAISTCWVDESPLPDFHAVSTSRGWRASQTTCLVNIRYRCPRDAPSFC